MHLLKNSGGSGVIVGYKRGITIILTNKHVCSVIKNGGLIETDVGSRRIYAYKDYPYHDLCLVKVYGKLGKPAKIAKKEPKKYDFLLVSGHPLLLPTTVVFGHLSGRMDVEIEVGYLRCTKENAKKYPYYCSRYGYIPIIEVFRSQSISALIQPGSSGSGVFNSKGEVIGVVFAGMGSLSYGFIVPYEYVKDFLIRHKSIKWKYPKRSKSSNKGTTYDIFGFTKSCINKGPKYPAACNNMAHFMPIGVK